MVPELKVSNGASQLGKKVLFHFQVLAVLEMKSYLNEFTTSVHAEIITCNFSRRRGGVSQVYQRLAADIGNLDDIISRV